MNQECVGQIENEIGRKLRKSEIDHIENKLNYFLNEVNRNPESVSMSDTKKRFEASKMAMRDAQMIAEKKAQRSASNLLSQAREYQRIYSEATRIGGKQPFYDALFNRMENIDEMIKGARNEALSNIHDTIKAAEPKFFELFENKQAAADLVAEVYGINTGNAVAKRGAKALNESLEQLRLRANDAGANIGKLDYAYLPQFYSLRKVTKMGKEAFTDLILNNLDRSRYHNVDGSPMSDAGLRKIASDAYETVSTDGMNKAEIGAGGLGSRSSKFDENHRSLHFNGSDGYINVMNEIGKGSLFESIQGHISGMVKDIVLMEELGANPNATFRYMKDIATKENGLASNFKAGNGRRFGANADMFWDALTGAINAPENARLAEIGQGIRNYFTGTKLGGAFLSSMNDVSTFHATYQYHGMPSGKGLVNLLGNMDGDYRQNARLLKLYIDDISANMSKWHANDMVDGWTGKMANTVMKASFLEAWTNGIRRTMSIDFSAHLADLTTKHEFGALDAHKSGYQNYLENRGVDKTTWDIWKQAERVGMGGVDMLTPDAINRLDISQAQKNRATAKLLGLIARESEYASLNPDLATRAVIGGMSGKKGTVQGELGRSFFLFKSFPIGMLSKHIRRIQEIPTAGGKLAYSSSLIVSLTLLGGLSLQLKDIVNGKDPREMDSSQFWTAAFVQGGGAGIFGDIAYTGFGGDSRGGQPNWTGLAGPVFGTGFDVMNASLGNVGKAADDRKTNFSSSAVRLVRQNTPGVGLWYAKGVVDHAVTHEVQEMLNPGYLNRMRRQARNEFKQDYWWNPGDVVPDRAPDIGKVLSD